MTTLRVSLVAVGIVALVLVAGVGAGVPASPAGYYGTVHTDEGNPVPDGTEVRVTVDNETTTTVTVVDGEYEVYLEADGDTVGFWFEETMLHRQSLDATHSEQNLTVPHTLLEDEVDPPAEDRDQPEEETSPAAGGGGATQPSTATNDTTAPSTNETTTAEEPTPWPTAANFTATPTTITTLATERAVRLPPAGEVNVLPPSNTTVAVGVYSEVPTTAPPGHEPAAFEVIGNETPSVTVPGVEDTALRALTPTETGWDHLAGSGPGESLTIEPPRQTPVVVVEAPPPAVTVAVPDQPTVGEPVVLNATVEDAPGSVTAYEWTVGEQAATGPTPTVTFEEAGPQQVTLTVETELNTTATTTTTVPVVEPTDRPWLEITAGVILLVTLVIVLAIRWRRRTR